MISLITFPLVIVKSLVAAVVLEGERLVIQAQKCRIVAWMSWMWALFSTAYRPMSSVAP